MSNKTFLTLHGGIYLMFALALFFVPDLMWPMYGVEINDQYAYFLSQHTSIFLGGIATICLMLREIESDVVAKQLLIALVITNLLGVIITFYAGVKGIFIGFGWSDPAFFAMLSVMGYLQLKKQ
ncbi:TPA: hypothetical protein ACGUVV_003466 [Vibrio vulnificus]|uniref:hypothetical protein n=1 Tax=Vibrio vulnificus TaxID=672 RepID=UPI0005F1F939|nr:hypothetical protein [Vibrio vulnificus]ELH4810221.1 hypothetical protein [Vibrio vulnificus]ELV8804068.1 hypothetical protein [Vibrio vulnificus]KLI68170.1 membrane protein [Vibrio vulnificus CladeA-yb158]MCA4013207.1 hypothetical protein [Vibrio vulnificus]MDS1804035.1 hypothetical protein [Vibrio vulnificus]